MLLVLASCPFPRLRCCLSQPMPDGSAAPPQRPGAGREGPLATGAYRRTAKRLAFEPPLWGLNCGAFLHLVNIVTTMTRACRVGAPPRLVAPLRLAWLPGMLEPQTCRLQEGAPLRWSCSFENPALVNRGDGSPLKEASPALSRQTPILPLLAW